MFIYLGFVANTATSVASFHNQPLKSSSMHISFGTFDNNNGDKMRCGLTRWCEESKYLKHIEKNNLSNTKKCISTKQTMKEEKILNWKVEADTSKYYLKFFGEIFVSVRGR